MGILDSQESIDHYLASLFPEVPEEPTPTPKLQMLQIEKHVESWLEENLERLVIDIFEKRLQEKMDDQQSLQGVRLGVILSNLTGKDYYDTQG